MKKGTLYFGLAALGLGLVLGGIAGGKIGAWWGKRVGGHPSAPTGASGGVVAPVPVAAGATPSGKYVPPELGVDLRKLQARIARDSAEVDAWIRGWIAGADTGTIGYPPAPIRDPALQQLWSEQYLTLYQERPTAEDSARVAGGRDPGPLSPGAAVDAAVRSFGVGLWPGWASWAEYRPETGGINWTMGLTVDAVVLHRFRLGGQANLYEAGLNAGWHLPQVGTAMRNTYLRALVNKRYTGGRWPDSYGLGLGGQF